MQQLREELAKAQALHAGAKGPARYALEGLIRALTWAIEGGPGSPSEEAARIVDDPLDHDDDGKKGGSKPGHEATAQKRAKSSAKKRNR